MKNYILSVLVIVLLIQGCTSNSSTQNIKQSNNKQLNNFGHQIDLIADSFRMYDLNNGWIETTVTNNGGKDWTEVTPKQVNSGIFYSLNKNIAYIASSSSGENRIYRTFDQGNTWDSYPIGISKSDPIYSVSFIDSNIGWITGQMRVL